MEKVLVTGANGLLGQYLVPLLLAEGFTVIAVGKGENRLPFAKSAAFSWYSADITDDLCMNSIFELEKPETVVHAAAITQVDQCQQQQENCEAVNVRATAQLLLSAETYSRHFIYISTDFVFDGEKGNYAESDEVNPLSWYGFTKVQAEAIVETSEIPFSILRTCLVYGKVQGGRNNIISWVRSSLEECKPIKVVNDQWRTPTYAGDLAKGILLTIQRRANGTFHIAGKDLLTPYDMAIQTAAFCKLNADLIEKTDALHFVQPARRPPKTGFNISKARQILGFEPLSFEQGLKAMLKGD